MKCSNCGYIYNGVGNPSNCPKCGYSFGVSDEEEKGMSTKGKIATGIGAAAGLAAGVGVLAYQNRDIVVKADEVISDSGNSSETITDDKVVDSNLNEVEVNDGDDVGIIGDSTVDVEDDETGNYFNNSDSLDTNNNSTNNQGNNDNNSSKNDSINSYKNVDETENVETKDDVDDKGESKNKGEDDNSSVDESNNKKSESDDNDSDEDSDDSSEDKDDASIDDSSESEDGTTATPNTGNDSGSNNSNANTKDEEDEEKSSSGGGGGSGSSGGGGGIGDIQFTPGQLADACALLGIGNYGLANGKKTFADAKECAGDALKSIKEASELAGKLNPDGNRLITANDLGGIVSNVQAVTGGGGQGWGYLDSLQNKANNLYNSYKRLDPDFDIHVKLELQSKIEEALRTQDVEFLLELESRGVDVYALTDSLTKDINEYFESEYERVSDPNITTAEYQNSFLFRMKSNKKEGIIPTLAEIRQGYADLMDSQSLMIISLGSMTFHEKVMLDLDANYEPGKTYGQYIEQNALDGVDKPYYSGTGKPTGDAVDDYKSDVQMQVELYLQDKYVGTNLNPGDEGYDIIQAIANHCDSYIGNFDKKNQISTNDHVYKLISIGVNKGCIDKDGMYIFEENRSDVANRYYDMFKSDAVWRDTESKRIGVGGDAFQEIFYRLENRDVSNRQLETVSNIIDEYFNNGKLVKEGFSEEYVITTVNSYSSEKLSDVFGDDINQYFELKDGKYVLKESLSVEQQKQAIFLISMENNLHKTSPHLFEYDENNQPIGFKGTFSNDALANFSAKATKDNLTNVHDFNSQKLNLAILLDDYLPASIMREKKSYTDAYNEAQDSYKKYVEGLKDGEEETSFKEMYPGLALSPDEKFDQEDISKNYVTASLLYSGYNNNIIDYSLGSKDYNGQTDIGDLGEWSAGIHSATLQKLVSKPAYDGAKFEADAYAKFNDRAIDTYVSTVNMLSYNESEFQKFLNVEYQNALKQKKNAQGKIDPYNFDATAFDELDVARANMEILTTSISNSKANTKDYTYEIGHMYSRKTDYDPKNYANISDGIIFSEVRLHSGTNSGPAVGFEISDKDKADILTQAKVDAEKSYNDTLAALEREYGVNSEEYLKFKNNEETYIADKTKQNADYMESLIIVDKQSKNSGMVIVPSNSYVKSYVEGFEYIEKNQGKIGLSNSINVLQYLKDTKGVNTYMSTFDSIYNAAFDEEAMVRANAYLADLNDVNDNVFDNIGDFFVDVVGKPLVYGVEGSVKGIGKAFENIVEDLSGGRIEINGLYLRDAKADMWGHVYAGYDSGELSLAEYYIMQASNSVGNMAIPMALGFIPGVGQVLSYAWLGTSAFGNTLEASKQEGMSLGAAYIYSFASAASEIALERFMGTMLPGSNKASALGFNGVIDDAFGEAKEEVIQTFLDPLLKDIVLLGDAVVRGVPFEKVDFALDDLKLQDFTDAAIIAMLSSGMTSSVSIGTSAYSAYTYGDHRALDYANIIKNELGKQGVDAKTARNIKNQYLAQFTVNKLAFDETYNKLLNDPAVKTAYEQQQKVYEDAKNNDPDYKNPRAEFSFEDYVYGLTFDHNTKGESVSFKIAEAALESARVELKNIKHQIANLQNDLDLLHESSNVENASSLIKSYELQDQIETLKERQAELETQIPALEQSYNNELDNNMVLSFDLNIDKFVDEINKLSDELNKLNENPNVETHDALTSLLQKQILEKQNEMIKFMELVEKVSDNNLFKIDEARTVLEKLNDDYNKLSSQLETTTDNSVINELTEKINKIKYEMDKINGQISSYKMSMNMETATQLENKIKQLENILNSLSPENKVKVEHQISDSKTKLAESLVKEKEVDEKNMKYFKDAKKELKTETPRIDNLLSIYMDAIKNINKKLGSLKEDGVVIPESTSIPSVVTDIKNKQSVIKYLNASVVGIGVTGMGLTSSGTATIGTIITGIDGRIKNLKTERDEIQKNRKNNKDGKYDKETSKRLSDVKQEIKQNEQIRRQLLQEMYQYNMDDNSPISDMIGHLEEDINSYYGVDGNTDKFITTPNDTQSKKINVDTSASEVLDFPEFEPVLEPSVSRDVNPVIETGIKPVVETTLNTEDISRQEGSVDFDSTVVGNSLDNLLLGIDNIVNDRNLAADAKFERVKALISQISVDSNIKVSKLLTDDVLSSIQKIYGDTASKSFIKQLLEITSDANISKLKSELLSKITPDMSEQEIIRYLYVELGKKVDYSEVYRYNTDRNAKEARYAGYKSIYDAKKTIESLESNSQIICVHWSQVFSEILMDAGIPKENIFVLRVKENGDYGYNTHAGMVIKLSDGSYIMPDVTTRSDGRTDLFSIKFGLPTRGYITFNAENVQKIVNETKGNSLFESLSNGYDYVIEEPSVNGVQGKTISFEADSVDKILLNRIGYHLFSYRVTDNLKSLRQQFAAEYKNLKKKDRTPETVQKLVEEVFGGNIFDVPINGKIVDILNIRQGGGVGNIEAVFTFREEAFFEEYFNNNKRSLDNIDKKLTDSNKFTAYSFYRSGYSEIGMNKLAKDFDANLDTLTKLAGWDPETGEITSEFLSLKYLNTKNMLNVMAYLKYTMDALKTDELKHLNVKSIGTKFVPGPVTSKVVLTHKSGRTYDCYYNQESDSIVVEETGKSKMLYSTTAQTYEVESLDEFSTAELEKVISPELKTFVFNDQEYNVNEFIELIKSGGEILESNSAHVSLSNEIQVNAKMETLDLSEKSESLDDSSSVDNSDRNIDMTQDVKNIEIDNQSLDTGVVNSNVDLAIQAKEQNNVSEVIRLANADVKVAEALINKGFVDFITDTALDTDVMKHCVEYIVNNFVDKNGNCTLKFSETNNKEVVMEFIKHEILINTSPSIFSELSNSIVLEIFGSDSYSSNVHMFANFLLNSFGYNSSNFVTISDTNTIKNLIANQFYDFKTTDASSVSIEYVYNLVKNIKSNADIKFISDYINSNPSQIKDVFEIINKVNFRYTANLLSIMTNSNYINEIVRAFLEKFSFNQVYYVMSNVNINTITSIFEGFIDNIYVNENGKISINFNQFYNKNWNGYQCYTLAFERILNLAGVDANSQIISNILSRVNKDGTSITNKQFYELLSQLYASKKHSLYANLYGSNGGFKIDNINVMFYDCLYNPKKVNIRDCIKELDRVCKNTSPMLILFLKNIGLLNTYAPHNIAEDISNGEIGTWRVLGSNYSKTGNIVFYNGVDLHTLIHEIAHSFDHLYGEFVANRDGAVSSNNNFSLRAWRDVVRADKALSFSQYNGFISEYAEKSYHEGLVKGDIDLMFREDFCDSVAEFLIKPTYFIENYPNRAKTIINIFNDFINLNYGFDKINDIDSLKAKVTEIYGNTETGVRLLGQINSFVQNNVSFNDIKSAFIDHFIFGSKFNITSNVKINNLDSILSSNNIDELIQFINSLNINSENKTYLIDNISQLSNLGMKLEEIKFSVADYVINGFGFEDRIAMLQENKIVNDIREIVDFDGLINYVNFLESSVSSKTDIIDGLMKLKNHGVSLRNTKNILATHLIDGYTMSELVDEEIGNTTVVLDDDFRNDVSQQTSSSNIGENSYMSIPDVKDVNQLLNVLDMIHGKGQGIKHINMYLETGDVSYITRNHGARDFITSLSVDEFRSKFGEISSSNSRESSVRSSGVSVESDIYASARDAYIDGDLDTVVELAKRDTDVMKDLLNNGKYEILIHKDANTQFIMNAVKYLQSIHDLDSISNLTLNIRNPKAAVRLLNMGVYNFNVPDSMSKEVSSKCIEIIKNSPNEISALLIDKLIQNNSDNVLKDIFANININSKQLFNILSNVSTESLNMINSKYLNINNKIKLLNLLHDTNAIDLLKVDQNDKSAVRKAKNLYDKCYSSYASSVIELYKAERSKFFKTNNTIKLIRTTAPKLVQESDLEMIKEIAKQKGKADYRLIDRGVGAYKTITYQGIKVRFFANTDAEYNKLYEKFQEFKKVYKDIPDTLKQSLTILNIFDCEDPDNDYNSITKNKSINRRFVAEGSASKGKFYLWDADVTLDLVAHEIAHSFDTDYTKFMFADNGYYTEVYTEWENIKNSDKTFTVTEYGDTSIAEDFAESMAEFLKDRIGFTEKYPKRASKLKSMLREMTFVRYGLDNITDMKSLAIHMIKNGVSQQQVKTILSKKVTFNAVKNAYIDFKAFGTDMQTSLLAPNNTEFRIESDPIKSDISADMVSDNSKAWFGNRVFAQRSSNPLVNQINKAIASGQGVVNVEINNASDMSVQALREISDLTKVQFFVKGVFSDINGNLKPKYNNPRYIARHTYTGSELIAINARLDQLQSRIDMRLPVSQRARQIYELIASEYNYLRPANGTRDKFNDAEYLVSQSLRGVTSNNIIGREGLICAGFASVFKELCTRCGVTADYIRGDVVVDRLTNRTGKHAWNVFIDENGNAVPVDACWRSGGGRDYFGRSNMFADGRYADPDEIFRDYTPVRQQPVVQVGFNDPKSMLDFAVRQMDAKYGSGAGINALIRYLRTGDIYSMTSSGGARNVLAKVSMTDIDAYIRNNSYVDLSIYNGNIMNAFNSMIRRHGSEQAAFDQLVAYAREGKLSYITSQNGAREIIGSIPIEAVRQFVNNRLSNPYYSEYASAEYVSEMAAPVPSSVSLLQSYKNDIMVSIQNLQNVGLVDGETISRINLNILKLSIDNFNVPNINLNFMSSEIDSIVLELKNELSRIELSTANDTVKKKEIKKLVANAITKINKNLLVPFTEQIISNMISDINISGLTSSTLIPNFDIMSFVKNINIHSSEFSIKQMVVDYILSGPYSNDINVQEYIFNLISSQFDSVVSQHDLQSILSTVPLGSANSYISCFNYYLENVYKFSDGSTLGNYISALNGQTGVALQNAKNLLRIKQLDVIDKIFNSNGTKKIFEQNGFKKSYIYVHGNRVMCFEKDGYRITSEFYKHMLTYDVSRNQNGGGHILGTLMKPYFSFNTIERDYLMIKNGGTSSRVTYTDNTGRTRNIIKSMWNENYTIDKIIDIGYSMYLRGNPSSDAFSQKIRSAANYLIGVSQDEFVKKYDQENSIISFFIAGHGRNKYVKTVFFEVILK